MKNPLKRILIIILLMNLICIDADLVYASSLSTEETLEETEETSEEIVETLDIELSDIVASGFYITEDNQMIITDSYHNQIYQYDGDEFTLIAGNQNLIDGIPTPGYIDGKAEYTLFDSPYMAVAWGEGIIVTDTGNKLLRYITNGVVITYSEEEFVYPTGLAVDEEENLYIADSGAGIIYKMSIEGELEIYVDDLEGPRGLYWYDDTLYVTDITTNQILSIQEGAVSIVAGKEVKDEEEWLGGYLDTTASEALFSLPEGIYVDETGIYVGDIGNQVIRKIINGTVYTVYSAENIISPVAITKYNAQLLVGDTFLKTTQEVKEKDLGLESSDTTEVGDVDTTSVSSETNTSNIWIMVGLLLVVLLGTIGTIIYIVLREKKKVTQIEEVVKEE